MKRKSLRFDINPLLGGPSLQERTKSGSPYRLIPIADIDVDPDQPRRVFDTESLAELAASIKEYGLLSPILVRVQKGGTFRLIAGERRLRASKLLGLDEIPALVDATDGATGEEQAVKLGKQLVENLQREDLAPMERSLAIGQLRDTFNWSIREIGKRLGISKGLVQRSLEVLNLSEDLQAALIAGAAESKLLLLGQIQDRAVRQEFLGRIDELSRVALEREIKAYLQGDGPEKGVYHGGTARADKSKAVLSTEDQRLVQDLQRSLSTKVEVLRKAGKPGQGKLVIEFYSDDDLNEIYRRLT